MNTQNNKLIAEFLGWDVNNPSTFPTELHQEEELQGFWELKFNTDWNYLIQVVENIESLGYDVFINTCVCRITDTGQGILEDIETFNYKNKKQAVYNACVEFIKWHKG